MKTIYKIIIACVITAVVTATVTAYITSVYYTNLDIPEFACKDNASPDINGCCPGEELKDIDGIGFVCCPLDGSECMPPITK
ncbi:MAG: hypothetical protein J5742_00130 [Alphaproteobacteria bacterium]|nr:hypothetical protein [Alphaproteobacteria bacterium]